MVGGKAAADRGLDSLIVSGVLDDLTQLGCDPCSEYSKKYAMGKS